MKSYLNIAAGKIKPIDFNEKEKHFLLQLDKMYFNATEPDLLEHRYQLWLDRNTKSTIEYSNLDVFEFSGRFKYQFDMISCYRFLEHVTKPEVQGFIYLLSTALKLGGTLDIIVPNYETLADIILNETINEETTHEEWERHDTLLTYELLNEPSMPHASIWTPQRIEYFFGLEERFDLVSLEPDYAFDGRDIYIRAIFTRVK